MASSHHQLCYLFTIMTLAFFIAAPEASANEYFSSSPIGSEIPVQKFSEGIRQTRSQDIPLSPGDAFDQQGAVSKSDPSKKKQLSKDERDETTSYSGTVEELISMEEQHGLPEDVKKRMFFVSLTDEDVTPKVTKQEPKSIQIKDVPKITIDNLPKPGDEIKILIKVTQTRIPGTNTKIPRLVYAEGTVIAVKAEEKEITRDGQKEKVLVLEILYDKDGDGKPDHKLNLTLHPKQEDGSRAVDIKNGEYSPPIISEKK